MQSKGAIRFVAILLLLACIWQLSFTLVSGIQEKKADKYGEAAVNAAMAEPAYELLSESDKVNYVDSIAKVQSKWYLDSISSEKVYLGYTYKDVKAKEINLGLDLKGGMNVMLQVQLEDLVKALSDNNTSPQFLSALEMAKENSVNSRLDFISLFQEAWNKTSDGMRLSQIFGTYEMKDKIKPESTDDEVIAVIRKEAESAVSNSFNVLRNRIDRFGVTQPNIQKLGNSGRILVELPGVKEPERVRKLLQGTASLEFLETYTASEVEAYLNEADATLATLLNDEDLTATDGNDSNINETTDTLLNAAMQGTQDEEYDIKKFRKEHPLYAALQPSGYKDNACIGFANYADTARINSYLATPQVRSIFPPNFRAMWSVKPSSLDKSGNVYELVAIKTGNDGKAPLDGGVVTDARTQYGNQGGHPEVSMSMDTEGANI